MCDFAFRSLDTQYAEGAWISRRWTITVWKTIVLRNVDGQVFTVNWIVGKFNGLRWYSLTIAPTSAEMLRSTIKHNLVYKNLCIKRWSDENTDNYGHYARHAQYSHKRIRVCSQHMALKFGYPWSSAFKKATGYFRHFLVYILCLRLHTTKYNESCLLANLMKQTNFNHAFW